MRPCRCSRAYSPGRSSRHSSSGSDPVKITVSIGNFSGLKWPLKKWIVKMNPTASRASSPCTSSAAEKTRPGTTFANSSGNQSISPEPPMIAMPQNTAQ